MKNVQEAPAEIPLKSETGRLLYIESYGCQMNFSDSEIVASILKEAGFGLTEEADKASLIFLNTCSIRENAEQKVRQRLQDFKKRKAREPELMVGVLGCMAERLKNRFLEEEKLVDLVVGPDSYRDLPKLVSKVDEGQKAVNVILSKEETYADISPVRLNSNGITAFISITRGCDNMCSFCVVPFTRGRERSRNPESIVSEARELYSAGFREITLLGQNVDSYLWSGGGLKKYVISEEERKASTDFAGLLKRVAESVPDMRIRFSTSHPKDLTDEVIETIARYDNICKYIHLPVQSGSSAVLERMNRGYTREWYMNRIARIKELIPDCGLSTDIITGFCGETEEDHQQTLSLMEWVGYDFAYMFAYSERPNTLAERKYTDDVSEDVKKRRLREVVDLQQKSSAMRTRAFIGKIERVLIEGNSRKSDAQWMGRNTQNTVVVFNKEHAEKGTFADVLITGCTATTLLGELVKS